jgi:hypothetical protein
MLFGTAIRRHACNIVRHMTQAKRYFTNRLPDGTTLRHELCGYRVRVGKALRAFARPLFAAEYRDRPATGNGSWRDGRGPID